MREDWQPSGNSRDRVFSGQLGNGARKTRLSSLRVGSLSGWLSPDCTRSTRMAPAEFSRGIVGSLHTASHYSGLTPTFFPALVFMLENGRRIGQVWAQPLPL